MCTYFEFLLVLYCVLPWASILPRKWMWMRSPVSRGICFWAHSPRRGLLRPELQSSVISQTWWNRQRTVSSRTNEDPRGNWKRMIEIKWEEKKTIPANPCTCFWEVQGIAADWLTDWLLCTWQWVAGKVSNGLNVDGMREIRVRLKTHTHTHTHTHWLYVLCNAGTTTYGFVSDRMNNDE